MALVTFGCLSLIGGHASGGGQEEAGGLQGTGIANAFCAGEGLKLKNSFFYETQILYNV